MQYLFYLELQSVHHYESLKKEPWCTLWSSCSWEHPERISWLVSSTINGSLLSLVSKVLQLPVSKPWFFLSLLVSKVFGCFGLLVFLNLFLDGKWHLLSDTMTPCCGCNQLVTSKLNYCSAYFQGRCLGHTVIWYEFLEVCCAENLDHLKLS